MLCTTVLKMFRLACHCLRCVRHALGALAALTARFGAVLPEVDCDQRNGKLKAGNSALQAGVCGHALKPARDLALAKRLPRIAWATRRPCWLPRRSFPRAPPEPPPMRKDYLPIFGSNTGAESVHVVQFGQHPPQPLRPKCKIQRNNIRTICIHKEIVICRQKTTLIFKRVYVFYYSLFICETKSSIRGMRSSVCRQFGK